VFYESKGEREREEKKERRQTSARKRKKEMQTDSQIIGSLLSFASSSFLIFTSCNANEL
jgi:VIT1/CCC1 family predicted Fe2+/Mn2+ transporter